MTGQNIFSRVFQVPAIAGSAYDGRMMKSAYVPYAAGVGRRARRQEIVGNGMTSQECEDESTEASQYYEYETQVRNVASRRTGGRRARFLGAGLLILLFA